MMINKIKSKLIVENAISLQDAEIERIFCNCVLSHKLIPMTKKLRDTGLLKFSDIKKYVEKYNEI